MKNVAPARAAAFEILLAVEQDAGHSDELLRHPSVNKLSEADRNLATNLVMGTLRWQIALDERIAALLIRPKFQLDPAVRTALHLGAFQLLYLDRIPAYAAIGESVELAKNAGNRFAAGMVNAILRKIASQSKPQDTVSVTNASQLASVTAHPQWLVERWIKNFGFESAKAICEYDQQPAPVFVRLLSPDAERELQDQGIELVPGNFLANVRRVINGDVSSTKAFKSGGVRIQDEGSQLVAELAGSGRGILDACAAPGGKTAILAE
ncbi:MAG TPA: transcription antitermination factor NusB, partial [Pseudacidobacterium sp.]|nr:transcription antitermination factor NusB [Pseudacidobacterium sp.]